MEYIVTSSNHYLIETQDIIMLMNKAIEDTYTKTKGFLEKRNK